MPRTTAPHDDLVSIQQRRERLMAELADLAAREKQAEAAARDAGRALLVSALERMKIPAMTKAEAKTIATAIARHGGSRIAAHLGALEQN